MTDPDIDSPSLAALRAHQRLGLALGAGSMMTLELERTSRSFELAGRLAGVLGALHGVAVLADLGVCLPSTGDERDRPSHAQSSTAVVVAAALRLADRALHAHAREQGYDTSGWDNESLIRAQAVLSSPTSDPTFTSLVEGLDAALECLLVGLHVDRMGVPDALADLIGGLLACFVVSQTDRGPP